MAYASTERISLVSSFLATLFLGRYAPIDTADGSGMNLMNVRTRRWEPELLKQCGGPELRDKLGEEPVEGGTVVGKIDEYWIKKWGFKEDCIIAPFTGDNPATLVSMNLLPGDCVVSLGTSDTVLLYLPPNARATIDSHLLAHPTDPHANMGMLCYKNGSLVRKHVRNEYAASNWIRFNELLRSVPPGGAEEGDPRCRRYGFYYLQQEIVPFARGVHRFEGGEEVEEFSGAKHGIAAHNVRALIESQFMSMKVRTSRMLGDGDGNDVDAEDAAEEERRDRDGDRLDDDYDHPSKLRRVLAAGGASRNPALLQALADVLDLPVHVQSETNSAGLGAALLARYAVVREKGEAATFKDMMDQTRKDKKGTGDDHLLVGRPDPVKVAVYEGMVDEFVRLEKIVVARQ
ncbi:FGGY family carbohydrate kinase [Jimgerdemannia flammicorona]|nr:FGGY family carbohydrate kinase [Jimgerdemannia flammicorona]